MLETIKIKYILPFTLTIIFFVFFAYSISSGFWSKPKNQLPEYHIAGSIMTLKYKSFGSRSGRSPYFELMVGIDGSKRYLTEQHYKNIKHLFNPNVGAKLGFRDVDITYRDSQQYVGKYQILTISHQGKILYDHWERSTSVSWKEPLIYAFIGLCLYLFHIYRKDYKVS
ncbi:hypothetical protein [Vibrio aestuarianus]|uniref:Uncharacterized protein n=1 Tax=Vibrio aestuarianus TaxID=28171 RepID=A0A9X4J1Z7_9VIBR|nr:hypothetical protein [Vibrio aestuarianus]MDE1237114.1 hypothetical protein [Vibrio aestuarianus]MDE1247695.1 hypothetical protein [Vibrio aestuarianus]MDE1348451.1 hypothetical protein [Vibrio aestuarianus]NGZ64870.1 hypothetical protein [Vibrio aestuarianus subsp. cardii]